MGASISAKATRLRCEFRENPLGIDTPAPRLSWLLDSTDTNARGIYQTAYQIKVSDGDRPLWDSGRVESSSNIHIRYAGRPLASGQRVTWQVRVWEPGGGRSDWSDSASWT